MRNQGWTSILILAMLVSAGSAQPYSAWSKYRTVTINTMNTDGGANVSGTVEHFPLLVRLSNANAASGADVLTEAEAGGADVRFATADGSTTLAYEIEHWSTTHAAIWVRVPVVAGNDNTVIRMYWGSSGAPSQSSPSAVFNASNGYKAVFHLNEPTGAPALDATGNYKGVPGGPANPANVPPGTGGTDAFLGNAKDFGGTLSTNADGGVAAENRVHLLNGGAYRVLTTADGSTANDFDFSGTEPTFTISAWVNLTSGQNTGGAHNGAFADNRRGVISKGNHSTNRADPSPREWYLRSNTQNNAQQRFHVQPTNTNASGNYSVVTGPHAESIGNWTYLSYSATGLTSGHQFRVRSSVVSSNTTIPTSGTSTFNPCDPCFSTTDPGASNNTATFPENPVKYDVVIGGFMNLDPAATDSMGHFFSGLIDEVRVSTVSRTVDWVDLEYQTQRPGQTAVTLGETQTQAATGPYAAWDHSRSIALNTSASGANVAGSVHDFPVLIRMGSGEATIFSQAKAGGADIRFSKADGETALPYEIEHWDATNQNAAIWVLVDTILGNNSSQFIRMYWGNAAAESESNGAAVFDTANGFEAVFHLNEAAGDSIRDATANAFKGVPTGTVNPANAAPGAGGIIGNSKHFGGGTTDFTVGGAYRLVTSGGGNTHNSFDYVGNDAVFTVSLWVNTETLPPTNALRRGLVTKADSGAGTANTNLQWHLRTLNDNGGSFSFLRTSVAPAPFSVARPNAAGNWTFVAFSSGATGNNLRVYNQEGPPGTATPANQNGVHQDVDVFIGGFAGAAGNGTQFLNGMIDEVRISNVARSNDWLDLSFQNQRPNQTLVNIGATASAPGAPTAVTGVAGNAQVAVSWTAPADNGGAAITSYNVTASPGGATCATTGATTCTVTGLTNGTAYTFTVTATNSVGVGPTSDPSTAVTPAATVPGAPTAVTGVAGNAQVAVSWTAPSDNGGAAITGYTVSATPGTGSCSTTGATTCTVTGLTNGSAYTFTVTATNSVGVGPASSPSTAVTPLAPPSGLSYAAAVDTLYTGAQLTPWIPTVTGTVTTWSVAPALPVGLSLNTASGAILGTPTAATAAANYTVTASNTSGETTVVLNITVVQTLGIMPGSFVFRVSGADLYTFQIPAVTAASTEQVTMSISDMWGRTVWSRTVKPSEDNLTEVSWNGRTTSGTQASAGMYVVRISVQSDGKVTNHVRRGVTLKPR